MRWKELEEEVGEYHLLQEELYKQRRVSAEQRIIKQAAKEKEALQKERERVDGVLTGLKVSEILEAVRDDVWQEGCIEECESSWSSSMSGNITRRGLRLISNPYPMLKVSGRFSSGNLRAEVAEERAALAVYVTPKLPTRKSEVFVEDYPVCNLVLVKAVPVQALVRSLGLEGALYGSLPHHSRLQTPGIDLESLDIIYRFRSTIYSHVDHRRSCDSLPATVREWSGQVLDKLPAMLSISGFMNSRELREWGHHVKGSSLPYRVLDRVTSKFGLNLPL